MKLIHNFSFHINWKYDGCLISTMQKSLTSNAKLAVFLVIIIQLSVAVTKKIWSNYMAFLFYCGDLPNIYMETCQGQEFGTASTPPTILLEITTGGIAEIPQTHS